MRALRGVCLGWGLAGAVVLAGGPANAQMESREAIALQNQILQLRQEVQQLRNQGGVAAAPVPADGGTTSALPNDITAQLLDRVTQLEDSVRQLRGRIDESDNARQRAFDDVNKRIGDLEFRAGGASGGANLAPASPAPASPATARPFSPPAGNLALQGTSPPLPPVPPGSPSGSVRRTPELALQEGNAALGRRDYAAAEAMAREVLAGPKGPRTTDAQYLLAQSLGGRHDYQGAAVAFDDAYTRNPKGLRAPESLLGLANSLSAINERKAACVALDKLRAEFPGLRQDLRPLVAAARQRATCG